MFKITFASLFAATTLSVVSNAAPTEEWNPPVSASAIVQGRAAQQLVAAIHPQADGTRQVSSDDLTMQIRCESTQLCWVSLSKPNWLEEAIWFMDQSGAGLAYQGSRGKVFIGKLKMPKDPIQHIIVNDDRVSFFASKNGTVSLQISPP